MEDGSIVDQIPVDFCRSQHHIGTGVPVKGKGAVSLAVKLNEGKGRGNLFVDHQTGHINAAFHKGLAEKIAESVFADFSDECCFAAQTGIHGKDIGGAPPGFRANNSMPCALVPFGVKSIRLSPKATTSNMVSPQPAFLAFSSDIIWLYERLLIR